MALTITKKDIPQKGAKVKDVEISKDGEVVWVRFDDGSRLISHVK